MRSIFLLKISDKFCRGIKLKPLSQSNKRSTTQPRDELSEDEDERNKYTKNEIPIA
jgi:hypothetical protein